jgi:hypothetical protein
VAKHSLPARPCPLSRGHFFWSPRVRGRLASAGEYAQRYRGCGSDAGYAEWSSTTNAPLCSAPQPGRERLAAFYFWPLMRAARNNADQSRLAGAARRTPRVRYVLGPRSGCGGKRVSKSSASTLRFSIPLRSGAKRCNTGGHLAERSVPPDRLAIRNAALPRRPLRRAPEQPTSAA